jgi:hypothetical protein
VFGASLSQGALVRLSARIRSCAGRTQTSDHIISRRSRWAWTTYVWHEAERMLGQRLDIELDETSMPAVIDHMCV